METILALNSGKQKELRITSEAYLKNGENGPLFLPKWNRSRNDMGGAHYKFNRKKEQQKVDSAKRNKEAHEGKYDLLSTWDQVLGTKRSKDPYVKELRRRTYQLKLRYLVRGAEADL